MRAVLAGLLSLAAVLAAAAGHAEENASPVPVEVWRRGDDGLTIRLSEAVEHALAASGTFVLSHGKKPGTLYLTFPSHVVWQPDGDRISLEYEVAFTAPDGSALGAVKGGCHEDELPVCVEEIVKSAITAGRRLP